VKHSSIWQCLCLERGRPFQTIALTCIGLSTEVQSRLDLCPQ